MRPVVQLSVTDNGQGIPPDLVPELFERFARGDSSRSRGTGSGAGSTGLGLAIVKAVVTAHHGTVRVTSHPGRTTFTITLPRLAESPGDGFAVPAADEPADDEPDAIEPDAIEPAATGPAPRRRRRGRGRWGRAPRGRAPRGRAPRGRAPRGRARALVLSWSSPGGASGRSSRRDEGSVSDHGAGRRADRPLVAPDDNRLLNGDPAVLKALPSAEMIPGAVARRTRRRIARHRSGSEKRTRDRCSYDFRMPVSAFALFKPVT